MHVLDLAAVLIGRRELEAACAIRKQYDRIQELERELTDLNRERNQLKKEVEFLYREAGNL